MFQDQIVLVGVGGGPLTWVAVDVLRALQRAGARVRVVLGSDTTAFVPALTFQTLTAGDVILPEHLYGASSGGHFRSLATLVQDATAMVIVPATPPVLAKLASGWADEALVRAMLVHQGLTMVAYPGAAQPYRHALVQHNVQQLRAAGVEVYDSGVQDTVGVADELGWSLSGPAIVEALAACGQHRGELAGKVVLITAGPTQEPIDPVRHISNRASGKTGFALAVAARQRGARVILVTGPTHLEAPAGVTCIRIQTALEMRQAVLDHFAEVDIVIKTAAVADFRPQYVLQDKAKKDTAELSIVLERNPDILAELGQHKGHRILVGFAAETRELLANARQKVHGKNLDFIVANDISDPSIGFASDQNRVYILDANGQVDELPTMAKTRLADTILDRVYTVLQHRPGAKV